MWARIESNKIVEYYDRKQSIVLNNVRYSSQIFTIWTDTQRKDLGIVPIVISGSHLDTNYYIEKNHSDAIAEDGNSVIRTIGVKAADRALEDVNEVWTQSEIDDDRAPDGTSANDPKLDSDGNQIITRGLKYNAIQKVKTQQAGFLSQTDWYIIRKADVGTAIPSNIQTWRNAIRADATEIETAITNAADMDAFIALHNNTYKEDGTVDVVARVNRWTELET
tara:strand:+ start:118 stop:783 length:666 start_codon:yes stop_codon:yes gene_type:complete